jgi:hypothetical protein
MITANGILFHHYRIETSKTGQAITSASADLLELPIFLIKSISVSKQAVKTYIPLDATKSIYLPSAMIGPVVKLLCEVEADKQSQLDDETYTLEQYQTGNITVNGLYSNDILVIVQFGFPTWNAILSEGSQWWVDTVDYTSKPGTKRRGKLFYEIELTIYRRDL